MKEPPAEFSEGAETQLANNLQTSLENRAGQTKPRRQPKQAARQREITLGLDQPDAHEVYVCGNFNDWAPHSLRMIRGQENGRWEKRLILAAGLYQYKFIVDGRWTHDPAAQENVANEYGSLNSVLEVKV